MKFKLKLQHIGWLVALTGIAYCLLRVKEGFGATSAALTSAANYVNVLGTTIMITSQARNLPRNAFCLQQEQCSSGLVCKNTAGVPINNPFVNSDVLNKLVYGTCN